MKYAVLILVFLFNMHFVLAGQADPTGCHQKASKSDVLNKLIAVKAITTEQDPQAATDERSGCCSHHRGVCGCTNGSAACCDGTLSPSCGCD